MSESSQPHHATNPPGSHYQPALSVVLIIVVLFVVAAFLMLRYVSPASSSSTNTTLPPSETTTTLHHQTVAKSTCSCPGGEWHECPESGSRVFTGVADARLELVSRVLTRCRAYRFASKATVVYFNPGFKWAAIQIAHKIQVGLHSIQALNGLRPVPGASSDDVIVILGHNSAQT